MNSHDLTLIGGLVILAVAGVQLDALLKTRGARPWIRFGAALVGLGVAAAATASRFTTNVAVELVFVVILAFWIGVFVGHPWYLRWRISRYLTVRLAEAVLDMRDASRDLLAHVAPEAKLVPRLRSQIRDLAAFRTDETSEYIDLVIDEMTHFVDDTPWPQMEAVQSRLAVLEQGLQAEFERLGVKGRPRSLGRTE